MKKTFFVNMNKERAKEIRREMAKIIKEQRGRK